MSALLSRSASADALLASYPTAQHAVAYAELIFDEEVWADFRAIARDRGPAQVLHELREFMDQEIRDAREWTAGGGTGLIDVDTMQTVRTELDKAAFKSYLQARLGML